MRAEQWMGLNARAALIDTVLRRFKLTAEQAVAEFGDKVSERIRLDAVDKPDTMHEFVHAIEPRRNYVAGSQMPKNLPVSSCHIEAASKLLVRESGYHEMPVIVPRWMQLPRSPYGVGPVSQALPSIMSLNELLRMEAVAVGRAAAGVYVAEDDGVQVRVEAVAGVAQPRREPGVPQRLLQAQHIIHRSLLIGVGWLEKYGRRPSSGQSRAAGLSCR